MEEAGVLVGGRGLGVSLRAATAQSPQWASWLQGQFAENTPAETPSARGLGEGHPAQGDSLHPGERG